MKVERRVERLVVASDLPLVEALAKMGANRRRVVFCIDVSGVLEGVLTDGDVRRWLIDHEVADLQVPVIEVANRSFTAAPVDAEPEEIAALFDERVLQVPLVDVSGRIVAVADRDDAPLRIGGREIGVGSPVFVVAEIGINHNGDVERGRQLVEAAAQAGVDAVKFQMRDLGQLYRHAGATDDAREDLGSQYVLDLLSRFELTPAEMVELFDHARASDLVVMCTAWDLASVGRLDDYGIDAFKVASADLTNHPLLRAVARTGRPVVVSTGMSEESEIVDAVALLRSAGASFALLHCNSTYPAPFRDVQLRYLARLAEIGACPVGYSGHERGFHVAVASVAMGAAIVEKHLTVDRSLEGNDHKVSLLPGEMADMVVQIRDVEAAMGDERSRRPSQGELMNRVTLAKSLVARSDLPVGHVVGPDDVEVKGPGRGLQPNRSGELIGARLRRAVSHGGFFYETDLDEVTPTPRAYRFRRPWGVPVRYHDVGRIVASASPDFVEFHLSYKDLDLEPGKFLDGVVGCAVAVHSPDLFTGDHILNLAAADDTYRQRSIEELRRTIDVASRIAGYFSGPDRPLLVVSLGGFSTEAPLPITERPQLYDRVAASLDELDLSGVELVAQTLPPFPWYMGGQLFCNLFVDPADASDFARRTGIGICLDVSHTKLAANHRRASFAEWVEELGPYVRHLHVVDAAGVDGEGLQIGDGEVDFAVLAEQLDRLCPGIGFIPEIWQGHRNDGEGFWIALDRLEQWL